MKLIACIIIVALTGCANEPLSLRGQFWHKHGITPEELAAERGPGHRDTWDIVLAKRQLTDAEVVELDRDVAVRGFARDLHGFTPQERRLQAGYHKRSE